MPDDRQASARGAAALRTTLAQSQRRGRPTLAVGAASAIAAHVAESAGFDALWISGLEVSTALGLPDKNVIGSRDLADVVLAVGRVTNLPVIVDVDNAGGTTPAAHRLVTDLTRAGASALCVEDSVYPKVNSYDIGKTHGLADVGLVHEQLAAMRDTGGEDLVLIARTEALICGGTLAQALDRVASYQSAGADAVLIHSRDVTGAEAMGVAQAWGGTAQLVTIPTAFPQFTAGELGDAGFSLIIYANQLGRASLAAMRTAASNFAKTGRFDVGPESPPMADVQDLLRVVDDSARASI
jgi:phosphoenolpyruvate phosphomutase